MNESNRKASAKYQASHIKRLPVNFNDRTDQDILQHLQGIDNVQGYIKVLIRADIAASKMAEETEW